MKRHRYLKNFLSPNIIFLSVVSFELILWFIWQPVSVGATRYISTHSFLIYVFANVCFFVGAKSIKNLKSSPLIINYSILKCIFVCFAILSLVSIWGFILKPFFIYGVSFFSKQIFHYLKLHQGGMLQLYYLKNTGINLFAFRWLIVPTFVILQELKISNKINKRGYIFLCVLFLVSEFIYSLSASSIMSFIEMLLAFIILFWHYRVKIVNFAVSTIALYLTFSLMVFLKRANMYGYNKRGLGSIILIGIKHL